MGGGGGRIAYWLNMLDTISISASAAASFSAEVGCGRAPMPKKDMLGGLIDWYAGGVVCVGGNVDVRG